MSVSAAVSAEVTPAAGPGTRRTSRAVDQARRRRQAVVGAVRQYFGYEEQRTVLLSVVAPEAAMVAPPIAPSQPCIERDLRRALDILGEASEPVALAHLVAEGVKHPGQAIYELQLAGFGIDRVRGGYRLTRKDGPRVPPAPPSQEEPEPAPGDGAELSGCAWPDEGLGLA